MTAARDELLNAKEIAELIAARKISPLEVVTAAIERIEARDPSLNAVVFKDFDGAISRARDLEARIMRQEKVGPLSGVPTLMKDLFDFRPGWPSTFGGIPALREFIPACSALVSWPCLQARTRRHDAAREGVL
jgi:amidase